MYVKREKPEGYIDPRTLRAKESYEGNVYKCKDSDQQYVIEKFIDFKHVQIYFIGTYGTRRIVTMNDIQNGVADPYKNFPYPGANLNNSPFCWAENVPLSQQMKGLTFTTNEGEKIVIVDYRRSDDVTVMFFSNGKTITTTIQNIRKGQVKNPYKLNKFGGYVGVGPYRTKEFHWLYRIWYNMLMRVNGKEYYDKYHSESAQKAYFDIIIDPVWLDYSNFANWYMYNKSGLNPNYQYELDKDILFPFYRSKTGYKKCYGPNTVLLVPDKLNSMISNLKYIESENAVRQYAHSCLLDGALSKDTYDKLMIYINEKTYK